MVYSAFSHRKAADSGTEPCPGPNVPADRVESGTGPARWWRTHLRAPRVNETPVGERVHPTAPLRAERNRRVGRLTHRRRTELWQQALFLAPHVAGPGVHPALHRQIDADGTA
ncbi:hypothetical protein AB0M45_30780 [Nocardia sp. NPDC051787]|uniref:hypothetical protein n=1 Tax=Nocardia sp. NPDC051787 TaxID=3155415 RepID=UPI0034382C4F